MYMCVHACRICLNYCISAITRSPKQKFMVPPLLPIGIRSQRTINNISL